MKKKITKKRILWIVCCIALVVIVYNLFWLVWRPWRYRPYTENFEEFIENMSYVCTTDGGYMCNVKMPDYPSFTGNLGVASADNKYALIIWPKIFSGYTYGVQLEIDGVIYSIMLAEDHTAQDSEYDDLVQEYSAEINALFETAEELWN